MESSIVTTLILPLSTAIIMLGMGLSLKSDDFKRILETPSSILIGLLGQIILLPLVGYALAVGFELPPIHAVGLMILVSCAGGAASNLIVYLVKADVALSVSLTALSSAITFITTPFIINFGLQHFMGYTEAQQLPLGKTNLQLFMLTVLPMLAGMYLFQRFPESAKVWEQRISKFAIAFVTLLVVGMYIKNYQLIIDSFAELGAAAFLLNVCTMAIGFTLAQIARLNRAQSTSISIEIGVQNGGMAMFIAITLLANMDMAIFPAFYSVFMYVNAFILVWLLKKRTTK
jgi:BASS family bile acid:Na+ symporter